MCPPAASPASDTDLYGGDKEIFMFLDGTSNGMSLPSNVVSDVNPYKDHPSALPEGVWFMIRSDSKKDADFGYWRSEGDACKIFHNSSLTGWRSTLEFFEGQPPLGSKTDWVMQEYWITRERSSRPINEKEICLLCNVFSVDEKPQTMAQAETVGQATKSVSPDAEKDPVENSTTKSQVDKNDANIGYDGADFVAEYDCFSGGDFLELRDLEAPASRSSISDSSCMSMSSGECFDFDLMRDFEARDESSRPNEIVPSLASTATGTAHESPSKDKPKIKRQASNEAESSGKSQGSDSGNEGRRPSTSRDQVVSDEDVKLAASGRKRKAKKKKYLCFIPF